MFKATTLQQLPENLYALCLILRQASQIIQQQYVLYQQGDDFDIQQKQDDSPVTQADLLANESLTAALKDLAPYYPVLSEEDVSVERHQWSTFWMIDPLDGTKEFIKKTCEFTVNLSLIQGGESVISALAIPMQNVVYIVEKGGLPFRWGWGETESIAEYQTTLPAFAPRKNDVLKIAMSRRPQHNNQYTDFLDYLEDQQIAYEKISAGSAYKFCMMLEGKIDIYPRFHPTSEWDTAAGQGLLNSIGGELFALDGKPFTYNQRDVLINSSFVAVRSTQDWQIAADFLKQDQRTKFE